VRLRGVDIDAGERALLLVGSANRDPAAFDDPARVALRTLFDRAPTLRLAGTPTRNGVAWNHGLDSVPVTTAPF